MNSMFFLQSTTIHDTYLSRTDSLTQLAGNASFLSVGVSSQSMLSPESRAQWSLLKWIVDGCWFSEEGTESDTKSCRKEKFSV